MTKVEAYKAVISGEVTEEVKGQNTIVIPSDLKSIYTTFLFSLS